jgi:hypothetical protein
VAFFKLASGKKTTSGGMTVDIIDLFWQSRSYNFLVEIVSPLKFMGKYFLFLNCFSGTKVPIVYILLCRPSEDSLQGNAILDIPDGSPSKDWQSTVGWGDCWILTQDCSFTIWCRYH